MSDGLKAQHRAAIIAALAANDRVERAVLFGSRAMGTNTITSDVDIALFGDRLTLADQAHLAATCDDLPMAQSVDLVLHNTIDNPALVDHIRTHGVEWYRRGGGAVGVALAEPGSNVSARRKIEDIARIRQGRYISPSELSEIESKDMSVPIWGANGIIGYTKEATYEDAQPLVTCRGNGCGLVQWSQGKAHISNNAMAIVLPREDRDSSRYLYYTLLDSDFSDVITGSAQPQITMGHLNKKEIYWHRSKSERKAIAHILGTLDDKIELNRRMNETLEAMAQAIFKDWFVDFGPVRAKVEGREAYLPEDVWGLFPDSFQESELGEIPRGWGVKPLSEIATFLNGLALQKHPATSPEDSLPVIKIAELRNGVSAKTDKASRNIPKKYIVTDGDFLFAWSGSLMAQFWTEGEGALNQHLFKVTSDQYPPWFFAGWVRFYMGEFQRIAASKATTMGHIQRSHLQAATVSCPPDAAVAGLDAVIKPLVRRGVSARVESRSLAKVRDLLLPKLMSGEIRVREGEKVMEVAA